MTFWTYANLAAVTQGTWLVKPDDLSAQLTGLWHDTRDIKPGQAYLAIAGENFDGHDFLDKAFNAGAKLAIVSKPSSPKPQASRPTLLVPDTVKALQDLARAYRDELKTAGCKVIGIAGSNGKTTTRHLIHHVLTHAGLKGIQSPKSFNNHLGVPLTLLSAKPTDDFVACEIGTNHPGEIDFLSAIARPDIAVITSIGEEHLEFFGNIDGVIEEEFSIANYFTDETLCVAGEYVPWEGSALEPAVKRAAPYAIEAFAIAENSDPSHIPTRICVTLAAWVAALLGVTRGTINEAIEKRPVTPGRWEKISLGLGTMLIHDAYNANPSSVMAAMGGLERLSSSRRVCIFGDMYELGESSEYWHREIGDGAVKGPIALFITIGPLARHAHDAAKGLYPRLHHFEQWSDDLPEQVAALLQPGDTVLLKASRGMRLERLIPAIERRFGAAQDDKPT